MSLPDDLLDQARRLADLDSRKPRQASLRRAVSTAYYALFHLLIAEATKSLIADATLRSRFARAFEHKTMKDASKAFEQARPGQPSDLIGGEIMPVELPRIAKSFVYLQEKRHEADYDTRASRRFTKLDVKTLIARADRAFADWRTIARTPAARGYLAALLIWKTWNR